MESCSSRCPLKGSETPNSLNLSGFVFEKGMSVRPLGMRELAEHPAQANVCH